MCLCAADLSAKGKNSALSLLGNAPDPENLAVISVKFLFDIHFDTIEVVYMWDLTYVVYLT